jgi:hypothetical protein
MSLRVNPQRVALFILKEIVIASERTSASEAIPCLKGKIDYFEIASSQKALLAMTESTKFWLL